MRELRNSLIPWLPIIPANWHEVRLKDIGTARNGLTYKPDDLVDEPNGTIVLRSSNIQNSKLSLNDNVYVNSFPEDLRVLKDDIIICSRNGSVSLVGKCALIEEDINATFGAFMMRFRTTQHPKFSFYLLQTTISAYKSLFGTTTVNQLTNSVFGNMLTALPTYEEQESIAAYLDKECEKIGRQIELLERKANAYNRLRRSLINRAVTRGLNPDVPLKSSQIEWIGDIPKHWIVSRFAYFFAEHNISNKGVNHQNLLSLSFGRIVRKNIDSCDGLLPASFETYQIVEPGNLIFRFTDLQNDHKSLRVGLVYEEGIITSAYTCVQGNNDTLPEFSFYLFHSYDIKKVFYKLGGGMRQSLNYKTIKDMKVVVPPMEEQKEIVTYLDEKCATIDAIVEKINNQIGRLKEFKRSLINEVVTGKSAIKNI